MGVIGGYLRELKHEVGRPVSYELPLDDGTLAVNECLGRKIRIVFSGSRACVHCGRKVRKLYQGYCYPCFTTLAECDLCIVKPHECHFHKGTCRDKSFASEHCMIPHYVYLAFSSGVKVGLTRKGRQFTRWIDQGASAAVLLAELPTRKAAGEMEIAIASFLPDKTDWRKMLQFDGEVTEDLLEVKANVIKRLTENFRDHVLADASEVHQFVYPRLDGFEVNLAPVSLDKTPDFEGVLGGVKGQYLLFDEGVLNVKKHAGYQVNIRVS